MVFDLDGNVDFNVNTHCDGYSDGHFDLYDNRYAYDYRYSDPDAYGLFFRDGEGRLRTGAGTEKRGHLFVPRQTVALEQVEHS